MKKVISILIAAIMMISFAVGAEDIVDDMYMDYGYIADDNLYVK